MLDQKFSFRSLMLVVGPIVAFAFYTLALHMQLSGQAAITLSITALCALWWVTEALPLAVTSFLPLALFPLLGVLTKDEVAVAYGSPLILLLLGGFILSTALESSGAHKRLALYMLKLVGAHSARRLVLGFMLASASLSMWISNTATTLMLLPIALAILSALDERHFDAPLLLGIGYAASVGGIGTPIGTPPNLIFQQVFTNRFGVEIDFLTWMSWGLPVVIVFVPIMGLWLTRGLNAKLNVHLPEIGRWSQHEIRVLSVFALTACAWIFRSQPFGGWKSWLDLPAANDASVALLACILMFIIPISKQSDKKLLDWDTARNIPWRVLILFAGGIALAKAFQSSGLSSLIGEQLVALSSLPHILVIGVICLTVTFLTEITSNTATTSLLMPILAAAAVAADIPAELLMAPAAMSASCAFMLPAATAPNAVIYSSNRVRIAEMARAGFVLNLLGVLIIATLSYMLI